LTYGEYSRRACREYHDDPAVASLVDEVAITTDEEFGKYRAEMTVEFTDGSKVTRRSTNVDEPTRADIVGKFDRNASAVLDAEQVEDLRGAIIGLPSAVNVRPVVRRLRRSP